MTIGLLIVDDQPLVRAGFRMILSAQPDFAVLGEAGDGAQALRLVEQLTATGTPPDVVVMDIRMPILDGVEATRRLCATKNGDLTGERLCLNSQSSGRTYRGSVTVCSA